MGKSIERLTLSSTVLDDDFSVSSIFPRSSEISFFSCKNQELSTVAREINIISFAFLASPYHKFQSNRKKSIPPQNFHPFLSTFLDMRNCHFVISKKKIIINVAYAIIEISHLKILCGERTI